MKKPSLVQTNEDIANNLEKIESYLNSDSSDEIFNEMVDYIKKGHKFISYKVNEEYHFAPSRFVGYTKNTLSKHKNYRINHVITGTDTDKRLSKQTLLGPAKEDNKLDKYYVEFCQSLDIAPEDRKRKYWVFAPNMNDILQETDSYEEGELSLRIHKQQERNRKAREKCIAIKGVRCATCEMDFEKVYGALGKGFIQVHHITPISEKNNNYIVDPIKDLVPVCPNCHAMLHRGIGGQMLTIEDLKLIIDNNNGTKNL